ncbi:toll-like receptor 5 [Eucyclogobius newberryi]|uniref:toll-like receptor 5 n=1 Tax=Eucyclogobius newberryi TaxID=166745 RepID=UPI003B5CBADD
MFGKIAKCSFESLSQVPVLPSDTEHLYLDNNHIAELDSESLRGLRLLEHVDLGAQSVQLVIRNNTFLRQRRLKTLILGSNPSLVLEPRAFAGLSSLQKLDLVYCKLTDSILSGNYLQPLWSLRTLDLSFNEIVRLRPAKFFVQLRRLTEVELKLNQIDRLCEEDLVGFQGKYFTRFNLHSNKLDRTMLRPDFDWKQCGNPFRNMAFNVLELSSIGFDMNGLRLFLNAIDGTPIASLHYTGSLGSGFSFTNLPDPDKKTFEGLRNSSVQVFDLAGNHIFSLQEAVFSPLTNAKIINVSNNKINQINPNAFSGLQNTLRMLNLSSNLIGEIDSHTFDNLTDLRVLDLSFNHIGALGHRAFSGLPSLKMLDLRGNSLRSLASTAYLPNLLYLFLSDNRLPSLWGLTELAGRNMTYLDVGDNRLNFLDDLFAIVEHFPDLASLLFGGNFIKWCKSPQTSTNNSLTLLDVHDSSLQIIWSEGWCLDVFHRFSGLLGLNLTHNSIAFLPHGIFHGLHSLTEIDLSSNALTHLQPDTFPSTLQILDLSNNFLASPNPDSFPNLAYIDLAGNHFYCDCNLEGFLRWLHNTSVTFLSPTKELRCTFPLQLQNLPLLNYSAVIEPCEEEDDEKATQELRLGLFILCTLAVAGTMLGSLVYARLRGKIFILYKKVIGRVLEGPKPPAPQENLHYDAFVCYSDADYKWVEVALLQKLDSGFSEENLFKCCFEARDFLPGEDHLINIRDAIWGSRKTVCVVSKEFLKDGWCLEAFTLAQGRKLEELSDVLIMIVVGRVAHYQLMRHNAIRAFTQTRGYLQWPEDPQDLGWFYNRLTAQILKDNKPQKKPEENDAVPMENDPVPMENDAVPMENIKPPENDAVPMENDPVPMENDAVPMENIKPPENDAVLMENDAVPMENIKPPENDAVPMENDPVPMENNAVPMENIKPPENNAVPMENIKPPENNAVPMENDAVPMENIKPPENNAVPMENIKPPENDAVPMENDAVPMENIKPPENDAVPMENDAVPMENDAVPMENDAVPMENIKPP